MKQNQLLKSILLLVAVFTFSMCEENGPIQSIVADEFTTTVSLEGLEGQSAFTITSQTTNISDLFDDQDFIKAAEVESVRVKLNSDYSGANVDGSLRVATGQLVLIDETVSLTKEFSDPIEIPAGSADVLSLITSGQFPVSISGSSALPIEDNDFSIELEFRIKATVEL